MLRVPGYAAEKYAQASPHKDVLHGVRDDLERPARHTVPAGVGVAAPATRLRARYGAGVRKLQGQRSVVLCVQGREEVLGARGAVGGLLLCAVQAEVVAGRV